MTTIWIHEDLYRRCFIVKREPSFLHIPIFNIKTGDIDLNISHGIEISIPTWDWIQQKDGITWAKYNGLVYDITDLSGSDEKTEKSILKQEGPA